MKVFNKESFWITTVISSSVVAIVAIITNGCVKQDNQVVRQVSNTLVVSVNETKKMSDGTYVIVTQMGEYKSAKKIDPGYNYTVEVCGDIIINSEK